MRQSLSRHVPGQASSRAALAPRAVPVGSTASNAPTPTQPSAPTAPASTSIPASQHPAAVPVPTNVSYPTASPAANGVHYHANGAPAAFNGAAPPVVPPSPPTYTQAAPGDLSQRLLMEQMSMLQRQLLDMASLVASTHAQNQALVAQVSALTQQVHVMAAPAAPPAAAAAEPPAVAAVPAAAALAAAPAAPVPPTAPAAHSVPSGDQPQPQAAPSQAAPADPTPPAAPMAAAQPREDRRPGSPAGAQPAQPSLPAAAPEAAPAHAAAAPPSAVEAQVQQLTAAAAELQALQAAAAAAAEAPQAAAAPQQQPQQCPTAPADAATAVATSAPPPAVPVGTAPTPGPTPAPTPAPAPTPGPTPTPAPASAAATPGTPAAVSAGAAAAPAAERLPGRGGRYVGPPRESWYQPPHGSQPAGTAAGAPGGTPAAASAGGAAASYPGGGAAWRGRNAADAAAAGPYAGGAGPRAQGLQSGAAAAGPAVHGGGNPGAVTYAVALDARIRRCNTVAELRAIVAEDRLSPAHAVLAAQQLPRFVRQRQERQQEAAQGPQQQQQEAAPVGKGPGGAGKGGAAIGTDAESAELRECHLRLLARFSTPGAVAAARPAFLPTYLALAEVCAEIRVPPSRAFAGIVRQLVTDNVAELGPELAAAGVAAVAHLDGTVAAGVLEKACRVLTDAGDATAAAAAAAGTTAASGGGQPLLLGWRALVAAGRVAPLGRTAAEAARQVLRGAALAAASPAAQAAAGEVDEALRAAAQGVLVCCAAGVAVPPALLQPLEVASCAQGVLASLGPSACLALAKAFAVAGYQPQDAWVDAWEAAAISSIRRTSPTQLAPMAAALHTLVRNGGANSAVRPEFVAAAAQRLLGLGVAAGAGLAPATCALALHLGELVGGGAPCASLPAGATELGEQLLSLASSGLAVLDTPDLAALVSGLSLLEVRASAEVWSALLSRATDAPAAAAAATAAARRALDVGVPVGIKPAALEHFLSVAGQHVPELPAASLVGLLGLVAAASKGKVRQALLSAAMTRVYDQAMTLGPRDAALLFSAVDALSVPLTEPMAARVKTLASGGGGGGAASEELTPIAVLRRVAEAALVPERTLGALGVEAAARLVEQVARLHQAAAAAAKIDVAEAQATAGDSRTTVEGVSSSLDIVPREQMLDLLQLLQPYLSAASPQALAALVGGAAALGLAAPPAWLAELVAAVLTALPSLDPLTSARIAAAVTRCEQLAGVAAGTGGSVGAAADGSAASNMNGSWIQVFVDDMQRKMAAAPPTALAVTMQVLVAHSYRPSATWVASFLAATTPFLEAPLPLTQAQAAGAAAVAAQLAASRSQAAAAGKAKTSVKPIAAALQTPAKSQASTAADATAAAADGTSAQGGGGGGSFATAVFTPAQLAQLVSGLTALQLQQHVPSNWVARVVQQVEGRAVQASYRDLADALYGIVQLRGVVREPLVNQLVISSQPKLSSTPLPLLSRMLSVMAAGEARKMSPKWWEDAQKVLTGQLKAAAAAANAAASPDAASASSSACVWQVPELSQAVSSVLALRRNKAGAEIGAPLAAALAEVVAADGAAVAAALPQEAAVQYVQACTELPYLGLPPPSLLERYLVYSGQQLSDFAGSVGPELATGEEPDEVAQPSKGKDKGHSKRMRARAAKRSGGGANALQLPQLGILPSALAVGKLLVETPAAQRPAAAESWLAALMAAGAAAAAALAPPNAATLLWLIARLDDSGAAEDADFNDEAAAAAAEERHAARLPMLQVLAERLERSAKAAAASAGGDAATSAQLTADQALDAAWALTVLGLTPSERLIQKVSQALPHRLAGMPSDVALPLLHALASAAPSEANSANALSSLVPQPSTLTSTPSSPLSIELGRYLEAVVLPSLDDCALVGVLEAAAKLGLPLPAKQVDAACSRLGASAELSELRGELLLTALMALRVHGAAPSEEQLEALCATVSRGAQDGTLGGVLEVAEAMTSLFDLGARPGHDFMDEMNHAIMANVTEEGELDGGVTRRPLTVRALVWAFWALASRFDGRFTVLAMAACKGVVEDLQGQLGVEAEEAEEEAGVGVAPEEAEAALAAAAERSAAAAAAAAAEQVAGDAAAAAEAAEAEAYIAAVRAAMTDADFAMMAAPLELMEVVMLLQALAEAGHEPPPLLLPLLERALGPALRRGATAAAPKRGGSGGAGADAAVKEEGAAAGAAGAEEAGLGGLDDAVLEMLLHEMDKLSMPPSPALLEDLVCYLGSRITVQQPGLLSSLASHLSLTGFRPEQNFMRSYIQRVENQITKFSPDQAVAMITLLSYLFHEAAGLQDAAMRARKHYLELMQGLLDCTGGSELVALSAREPNKARLLADLLIQAINNFNLQLPYKGSQELRNEWAMAIQALTLGRVGEAGWDHMGRFLRMAVQAECTPEPEWLAEYYKKLEAAIPTLNPILLSDATMGLVTAGYQPALSPTLPARIAMVIEERMRDLATTDPRVIVRLLFAVGEMGHVLRTEVLQAAEAVLAQPLLRATEILQEVKEWAAGPGMQSASQEELASMGARLEVATGLVDEGNVLLVCQVFNAHAYRPGQRLADSVLAVSAALNRGTKDLETLKRDLLFQPGWLRMECFATVLTHLHDWGVLPNQAWREDAAAALVQLAARGPPFVEDPDSYINELACALGVMSEWRHVFTEAQIIALQRTFASCLAAFKRRCEETYDNQKAEAVTMALQAAHGSGIIGGEDGDPRMQQAVVEGPSVSGKKRRALSGDSGGSGVGFGAASNVTEVLQVVAAPSGRATAPGAGRLRSQWVTGRSEGVGSVEPQVAAAEFRDLQTLVDDTLSGGVVQRPGEGREQLRGRGDNDGCEGGTVSTAAAAAAIKRAAAEAQAGSGTSTVSSAPSFSASPSSTATTTTTTTAAAAATATATQPVDVPSTRASSRRLTAAERTVAAGTLRTATAPPPQAPPSLSGAAGAPYGGLRTAAAVAQLRQQQPRRAGEPGADGSDGAVPLEVVEPQVFEP